MYLCAAEKHGSPYDIAICVVNYFCCAQILNLHDTLKKVVQVNYQILILDNSICKKERDRILRVFPEAKHVFPEKNLGYAAGNNLLISLAKDAGFPAIGILNPDIYLAEDCITPMVKAIQKKPEALHAPVVLRPYGKDKAVSFLSSKISKDVDGAVVIEHLYEGLLSTDKLPEGPVESDTLSGCAMFFSPTIIDKYGYIPEDYFLYFEETDWTYRMKLAGVPILVHTDTSIIHSKASWQKGMPTLAYVYYMIRGAILFAKKFGFDIKATRNKYRETFLKNWARKLEKKSEAYCSIFLLIAELGFRDGSKLLSGSVDILDRLSVIRKKSFFVRSEGFLETIDAKLIRGWAGEKKGFSSKLPLLGVFVNNQFIGETIPRVNRLDIKKMGFSEIAGFEFDIPEDVSIEGARIDVVNANTGVSLKVTEQFISQLEHLASRI